MSPAERDAAGFLSRWSRRKAQARQSVVPGDVAADQAQAPPDTARPPREVAPPRVPAPLDRTAPAQPAADVARAGATAAPASTAPTTAAPGATAPAAADVDAGAKPPAPTLADVAQLTRDSDYSRFVAPGVDSEVKNAALKKLFVDPHFNVMDGLDVYIDDYSKPDPLPASSIRQMAQAAFLGLIEPPAPPQEEPTDAAPPAVPASAADALAPDGAAEALTPAAAYNPDTPSSPGNVTETPAPHEDADLRLQPHDAAGCRSAQASAAADAAGQH